MPPSPEQRAEITERRNQLIRMRVACMSYGQIAARLKRPDGRLWYLSPAAAAQDMTRALADRRNALGKEAANALVLELERLDTYAQAAERVLGQARNDGELALKAIDRLARLTDRRIDLLGLGRGLAAPQPDHAADELRVKRDERRRRAAGG